MAKNVKIGCYSISKASQTHDKKIRLRQGTHLCNTREVIEENRLRNKKVMQNNVGWSGPAHHHHQMYVVIYYVWQDLLLSNFLLSVGGGVVFSWWGT